ncbi:MAG TPA: hypothetical protein VGK14_01855, partial [Novimethylophilus sp.]|uniref:hypothetical protein n=1 Tax=Novimethylophilus sp. TaxID=2137426 RepID=UPI002F4186D6
ISLEVVLGRQVQNAASPRIGVLLVSKFVAGWTIYLNHLVDFMLHLSGMLGRSRGAAGGQGSQYQDEEYA